MSSAANRQTQRKRQTRRNNITDALHLNRHILVQLLENTWCHSTSHELPDWCNKLGSLDCEKHFISWIGEWCNDTQRTWELLVDFLALLQGWGQKISVTLLMFWEHSWQQIEHHGLNPMLNSIKHEKCTRVKKITLTYINRNQNLVSFTFIFLFFVYIDLKNGSIICCPFPEDKIYRDFIIALW